MLFPLFGYCAFLAFFYLFLSLLLLLIYIFLLFIFFLADETTIMISRELNTRESGFAEIFSHLNVSAPVKNVLPETEFVMRVLLFKQPGVFLLQLHCFYR